MDLAKFASALSVVAALAGCASMLSGVGGTDTYACKAPQGVLCTSVAGVYANSIENNLPSQRREKSPAAPVMKSTPPARPAAAPAPPGDGAALRSSPRILRVWIAPWEDSDGDLHDQSFLYVLIDTGRWLIEHQRSAIRNEFMPIASPQTPPVSSKQGATSDPDSRLPLPAGRTFVSPAGGGTFASPVGGEAPGEEHPDAQ